MIKNSLFIGVTTNTLIKKSKGSEAKMSYLGHARMENRHGLVVDTMVTLADGGTRRGPAHGLADFGCEAGDTGWRQEFMTRKSWCEICEK
jgi:hypothetical protein